MAATAFADPAVFVGTSLPKVWRPRVTRAAFGNIALVVFLLSQCFDGIFTYIGVLSYGIGIEANPVIAALMMNLGHGAGLVGAKTIAAVLGMCLHLRQVHTAVALLAAFYVAAAVLPWTAILFF